MIAPVDDISPADDEWCRRLGSDLRNPGQCPTCGGWWSIRAPDDCCPQCHFREPKTQKRAARISYNPSHDYDPADVAALRQLVNAMPLLRRAAGRRPGGFLGRDAAEALERYRAHCRHVGRPVTWAEYWPALYTEPSSARRALRRLGLRAEDFSL